MLGTIKKKVLEKGFWFISPEDGWDDLFFHFSALENWIQSFEAVEIGQKVQFDVINGRKTWTKQAENITKVDEEA